MEKDFEKILDDCVNYLREGKSIEECLAKYPEYSLQLKPLLQLARAIELLPKPEPAPEMFSAALVGIGKEIAPQQKERVEVHKHRSRSFFGKIFQQPRLAWAFSIVLLFLVVLFSAATISANSVPGDILYPLKLATEKVKFLLTFNSERKAELRLTFSDKRLHEMITVFQKSNSLDTTLLKAMLDEAKLALEDAEIPAQKASPFFAKLKHINAYQKDVLGSIRPQVDSTNIKVVEQAIRVSDMRSQWMMKMMREERDEMMMMPPPSTPSKEKHRPRKWQWGPGCDWMR